MSQIPSFKDRRTQNARHPSNPKPSTSKPTKPTPTGPRRTSASSGPPISSKSNRDRLMPNPTSMATPLLPTPPTSFPAPAHFYPPTTSQYLNIQSNPLLVQQAMFQQMAYDNLMATDLGLLSAPADSFAYDDMSSNSQLPPMRFPISGMALGLRLGVGLNPSVADYAPAADAEEAWGYPSGEEDYYSDQLQAQLTSATNDVGGRRRGKRGARSQQWRTKKPRLDVNANAIDSAQYPSAYYAIEEDEHTDISVDHRPAEYEQHPHLMEHPSSTDSVTTTVVVSSEVDPLPSKSQARLTMKLRIQEFKHLMDRYDTAQTAQEKKTWSRLAKAKNLEVEAANKDLKEHLSNGTSAFSMLEVAGPSLALPRSIRRYPHQFRHVDRQLADECGFLGIPCPDAYIIEVSDDEDDFFEQGK